MTRTVKYAAVRAAEWAGWLNSVDGSIVSDFLGITSIVDERHGLRLKIVLIDDEAASPAETVRQVGILRQLYATLFLINADRSKEIAEMKDSDVNANFDRALAARDRLVIQPAAGGSFWLTIFSKRRIALQALFDIVPLLYGEGRRTLLRRFQAEATFAELELEQKALELKVHRVEQLLELFQKVEKIKDPGVRESVKRALTANIRTLRALPLEDGTASEAPRAPKSDIE